jgi:long-chain acyl-CoA synthetase
MAFDRIWHKSYAPGVSPEIEFEKITTAAALIRSAKKFPDHTAFIYMGRRFSYREMDALVNRFANALKDLGVKEGDKVGMLLPNLPQMIIACHATHRLGAVTAMNNPLYTEKEMAHQLKDCDARFLITLDLLLPRALALKGKTGSKRSSPATSATTCPFRKSSFFPT